MVGLLDWRRRLEAEKEDVAPREAIRSKLLPLTPTLRHTHTPATSASCKTRPHAYKATNKRKFQNQLSLEINLCMPYPAPTKPKDMQKKKSLLRQSCLAMTLYVKQASGRKCSPTKTEA
ncbi:conserved hypothetical protein [Trichinella spiralis]|uniref:Uncharacterized protein n=1 Tax=Trichinella spiralis TaxID=6334 RepID=E5SQK8_TRISP|nr:conserved hypothetical protein [Trichinella spiralis]KRY34673.1 hypothetical protein T01_341 [Trichinella spiralis]